MLRPTALTVVALMIVALAATPASADRGGAAVPYPDRPVTGPFALDAKTVGPVKGVSPRDLAIMTMQEPLDKIADRIESVAKDTPASGLGGITVDAEHNSLNLYWHGDVSQAVQREVDAARQSGVTVKVTSAAFTRTALRREADRLADLNMSGKETEHLASVAPKADASGLSVGIRGLAPGLSAVAVADSAHKLTPGLASSVPMDVSEAAPSLADRWFDSKPYWGGSFIQQYAGGNPTGVACSAGFGVTGLNGAATYMMFANHCGPDEWRTGRIATIDGAILQHTLGSTIVTRDVAHDTQLILTPEGSGNAVYIGESWLGHLQQGVTINASAQNRGGDAVCTSGSYSGTVCNIRVAETGVTLNVTGYGQMRDLVRADHQAAQGAAGNGDSGGPVITTTAVGVTYARGTMSAQNDNHRVPCFGVPESSDPNSGRHCSWEIYYPDITVQLAGVGVRLNTG
jgi:streptogrisin D